MTAGSSDTAGAAGAGDTTGSADAADTTGSADAAGTTGSADAADTTGSADAADTTGSADAAEARALARALGLLVDWAQADRGGAAADPVVALLREHLGDDALEHSIVTRTLPAFEHVNLQLALAAWTAQPGRTATEHGWTVPPHHEVDLHQMIGGEHLPPMRLSAPDLVDLPSGPGRTTACMNRALVLVTDDLGRYVLSVRGPDPRHGSSDVTVQVTGLPTARAQRVLADLDELRSTRNAYRGQVIELVAGGMSVEVAFPRLPPTERDDVVLPEVVLRRIERHALEVAEHRAALRAAVQHLKRGLLLHGPPGTGKTHTVRYLVQHLPGATVIMLSGRSLALVGTVTDLARELAPSVVVLEDVDLVAEDRAHGPGASPVLFELLDAMDGAVVDADLLFLLTTNRADLLEPALAARPGRVDVAVEVGLPDAAARRRLLAVHSRGTPLRLTEDDVELAVARTDGVTASFVKELVRRTVLEALTTAGPAGGGPDDAGPGGVPVVTGEHLRAALDDLLDSTQGVTRALLGVPADQSSPPATAPVGQRSGHGGAGWIGGAMTSSLEIHHD